MKDKQKVKVYNGAYYAKNREKLLPKLRKRAVKWCKDNRARRNAADRKRRAGRPVDGSKQRRYRAKLKEEAFKVYGRVCACCGESVIEFLTFDHVNGGGTKHRKQFTAGGGAILLWLKQHGYPKDFRVLCFNCNWSAHVGNGKCYHERQRERGNNLVQR